MSISERLRDIGDGPVCPEPGNHGKTYVMGTGRLWCAVTQTLFDKAVFDEEKKDWVVGPVVRATGKKEEPEG